MTIDTRPAERQVITAQEVAKLLGYRCRKSFDDKRQTLEKLGFPPKVPGLNNWSRAAVLRWIETNGETYLPTMPDAAAAIDGAISLEQRYAR